MDMTVAISGNWTPLLRKDPRNAGRILKKLREVERDKPPTQQYLFLLDVLDWWEINQPSIEGQCAVLESGLANILIAILLDKRTIHPEFESNALMNQAVRILYSVKR
ncbi:hypothetical protein K474DRAFT_664486 [Panus rudis PR-1116 ss-1]|nr:hypothetical protein K474DRAFT_664486 [Panus rudis PR-1116 ss-1]